MHLLLVLLAAVSVALSDPVKESDVFSRRYDPSEENPYRIRFILTQDDDGRYHITDLFKDDPRAERLSINDVTFYLYTQNNRNNPDIIPANNFNALSNSHFQSSRRNIFVAHGWNNNFDSAVNRIIRPAILERNNVNLFVIDWSRPANLFYTTARNAVPAMGNFVGDFINRMMATYNIGVGRFDLVGHSLGAHLVGCAGARINGLVNSIVGLDPAGPLYTVANTAERIDTTDGQFVQIIHTNSGLLGFSSSLGHADYFPNGGRSQPGCGLDLLGTCAHGRAYEFFAESVLSSRFGSRRCTSINDYSGQRCNSNHRSLMGELNVDQTASGDYYLLTWSTSPFAMG